MSSFAYSFLITVLLFLVVFVVGLGIHALILLERILKILQGDKDANASSHHSRR
jgi:hypothetical protein